MSDAVVPAPGEEPLVAFEVEAEQGPLGWTATVDHKRIGLMYLFTAAVFLIAGGIEALIIRLQLAVPENNLVSPQTFNQIFTMHGTTMIFFVVMPILIGFANYFVPLMIGARDMAFPRLNAFGWWMLVFGGFLLYYSVLAGGAPNAGWFSYAPLSEQPYALRPGLDYYVLGLLVSGLGTVTAGLNFIVTIFKYRAPGMGMSRMPLFVWMVLVTSFIIIFAFPPLNAGLIMLFMDRFLHGHFFRADAGSPVMWQHYFWAFGHPEVYIMALPAFGMISEVLPVFSRKPIFGYAMVAASGIAIGFLSFGVWVHHMFAVGLGFVPLIGFGASSMLIAVPTGVKIWNWLATIWGGKLRINTSMLFAVAFLMQFTIGGLSGVTFAIVPLDWQTTDTYYVVAHFHYVLFGGTLFAILAGLYYWFPKMSGRMLNERLGRWTFWMMVLGFNGTFFIQHALGLIGMPRRIFTYPDLPNWGWMNLLSTIGAFGMAAAFLLIFINLWYSLRHGEVAGDNPWDAWTLEWATSSPPPHHNFESIPEVRSRRPLWDLKHPDQADYLHPEEAGQSDPALAGGEVKGWWGRFVTLNKYVMFMALFIASEATFFTCLIIAYIYFHVNHFLGQSGPTPHDALDINKAIVFTVFLLLSSGTFMLAERALAQGKRKMLLGWLSATCIMGAIFLCGQAWEYVTLLRDGVAVSTNAFGTTFFTVTGLHGLHVLTGLIAILVSLGLAEHGWFKKTHSRTLTVIGMYWHFVDVVWILIFSMIYLWSRMT
ncbi:MAG: cytochrome c oxidase subunit I [Candidatus Xenobia bacterium]